MSDDTKPPSSLTQIPTAALPKFGFNQQEAYNLTKLQLSSKAAARREQEEEPGRRRAKFAKSIAPRLIAEEWEEPVPPPPGTGKPPNRDRQR